MRNKQELEILNRTGSHLAVEHQAFILGYWTSYKSLLSIEIDQIIFGTTFIKNKIQGLRNINIKCQTILFKIKTIIPFNSEHQNIKEDLIQDYTSLSKKSNI